MTYVLDACHLAEEKEAQEYLKNIFDFPDYYGKNLDALYDCLTDIKDLRIVLINHDGAGGYYKKVLRVFKDAGCVELI